MGILSGIVTVVTTVAEAVAGTIAAAIATPTVGTIAAAVATVAIVIGGAFLIYKAIDKLISLAEDYVDGMHRKFTREHAFCGYDNSDRCASDVYDEYVSGDYSNHNDRHERRNHNHHEDSEYRKFDMREDRSARKVIDDVLDKVTHKSSGRKSKNRSGKRKHKNKKICIDDDGRDIMKNLKKKSGINPNTARIVKEFYVGPNPDTTTCMN